MEGHFLQPTAVERTLNKAVGFLAKLGLGPAYVWLLEVKGRKSGRIYTTPVNLHELGGRVYLVGGRGHTGWSKNAQAAGLVSLRRGGRRRNYRTRSLPDNEKPPILKSYLERYPGTVQRFFSVPAGSPVESFRVIADHHPVLELIPI